MFEFPANLIPKPVLLERIVSEPPPKLSLTLKETELEVMFQSAKLSTYLTQ